MTKIPLVLLPGLLCDDRLWRDQVSGLGDIADPVIADLTQDDTIEAMARRVLSVAPSSFALAGLSMGGYVAFEIMRQSPERVRRLALMDTSAAPDSPARMSERMAGISSLQLGRFVGVTNRLLPKLIHPSAVDGEIGEDLKAMAARVGKEGFLKQQFAILGRPDSRPLLQSIRVPTLVAVGDSDVLTPPSDAQELHRGIPGAWFRVFKNCGHLPPLECPKVVSDLMREWLLR